MKNKKIVVSGIQPTGNLHLGNYLGAIKQWKELQKNPDYECRFGIMDLHAMTTKPTIPNDNEIRGESYDTFVQLIKLGISYKNLFYQSLDVSIVRMYWKLACNTSIGQLNRMTQFKEKSDKGNENLGLFSYPVLMAADILALEADLVPVGEDQKQHLELARDLAKKLGLKVPKPLISESCGRIMSLTDPAKKMSKSDPNDNSRINLSDDAETIRKKIKKATTTPEGKLNLQIIYKGCGGAKYLSEIFNDSAVLTKEIIAEQIIKELNAK
jgi:tryptophanyl-tRNA synthetase